MDKELKRSLAEQIKRFVAERDRALLSLDKETILAYMRKYEISIPPEKVFWAAVHKARLHATSLPPEAHAESFHWLTANGWKTDI